MKRPRCRTVHQYKQGMYRPGALLGPLGGIGQDAANWWEASGVTPWAAYAAKGAASLAASYFDLSGNGNNAVAGVAPTWNGVQGWIFDGATQYLDTLFVPQNDQSQSILIQFTNVTNTGWLCGMSDGATQRLGLAPDSLGGGAVGYINGNNVVNAPSLLSGHLAVAGNQGYRNGMADGAAIGAWGGVAARSLYIGARNVATLYCAGMIQAVCIFDVALTAPQVAAVAAAMAAL